MKIILVLMVSCAVSCANRMKDKSIQVSSSTKAKVFLYEEAQNKWLEIGETPFKMPTSTLSERFGKKDWIYLQVSAPGYAPEQVLLPLEANTAYELKMNLKEVAWWNDPQKILSSRIVQQVGVNVQSIYRLIRLGKLGDSLKIVEGLLKEYPDAAILYDIRGSIYVLQGANDLAISLTSREFSYHYQD